MVLTRQATPSRSARRARLRRKALQLAVWTLGLGPLAWLGGTAVTAGLGPNPPEAVIHWMGRWGLALLLATLAVTPARRLSGWNELAQIRRTLGLLAFLYLALHLLAYVGLDQFFDLPFIVEDVLERPFIAVGSTSFLLLVPLAVTSTRGWIRRLGRKWRLLHRLVYPAAALGVLHYYWEVKADTFWPLVAAAVLGGLLLLRVRVPYTRQRRSTPRVPLPENRGGQRESSPAGMEVGPQWGLSKVQQEAASTVSTEGSSVASLRMRKA